MAEGRKPGTVLRGSPGARRKASRHTAAGDYGSPPAGPRICWYAESPGFHPSLEDAAGEICSVINADGCPQARRRSKLSNWWARQPPPLALPLPTLQQLSPQPRCAPVVGSERVREAFTETGVLVSGLVRQMRCSSFSGCERCTENLCCSCKFGAPGGNEE